MALETQLEYALVRISDLDDLTLSGKFIETTGIPRGIIPGYSKYLEVDLISNCTGLLEDGKRLLPFVQHYQWARDSNFAPSILKMASEKSKPVTLKGRLDLRGLRAADQEQRALSPYSLFVFELYFDDERVG